MKKILSLVMVLTLLVGSLWTVTASADIETWYVKTGNGGGVNVRNVETGEKLTSLPYGSEVHVEYFVGDWAIIVWGSLGSAKVKRMYLSRQYPGKYNGPTNKTGSVLTDSALGSQTVEGLNKQYSRLKYVAGYSVRVVPDTRTGTARLRWAPSKHSKLIAQLPANYTLQVIAESSNWLMVQDPTSAKIGYIATKYTTR